MGYDFFEAIMMSREKQTDWFADIIQDALAANPGLPVIILGEAFKPETNLITGSPSRLLVNVLKERGIEPKIYDPKVHGSMPELVAAVYFIGTRHDVFSVLRFPSGSVVIDPHRYVANQKSDVRVIKLGQAR
jgi:UDPglucose 6-dehydrogenase